MTATAPQTGILDFPKHRRLHISSLSVMVLAYLFFGLTVLLACTGTLIAPSDPGVQHLHVGVSEPSHTFLLGTDELGRDILSRAMVGARTAMVGPFAVALGAMLIGTVIGLVAGYWGGWIDTAVMRWVDVMSSLPGLLVALVAVGGLGGGYWLAVAILVVLGSPNDTKIVRAAAMKQRPLPYVEAAQTLGLSHRRVIFRHMWPNVLPVIVANTFLHFSFALISMAALSFLGIGVQPGTPDWGLMLAESRAVIFQNPAAAIVPALLLALTSVTANLIGDDLFERFSKRGRGQ